MTHDTSALSVVIPTHETRELTLAAVRSVLSTAPGAEVIVVDDASRDGTTVSLTGLSPSVEVLRNAERRGFSATANVGLRRARGTIVVLLNSDTEVRPGALLALQEAITRNPSLGIAGARLVYPDGRPQWSGGRFPTLLWLAVLVSGVAARRSRPRSAVSGGPAPVDWVTGAAMAIRRDVLETIGILDEGYTFYAQDLDLCRRARQAGWTVEVVARAEVVHHHGRTIGTDRTATGGARLDLLWSDLLRYVTIHDGRRRGRHARLVMRVVLATRRLVRAGLAPLIPPDRRADHAARGAALSNAAAALRQTETGNHSKEAC